MRVNFYLVIVLMLIGFTSCDDSEENKVPTDIQLSSNTILENEPAGTVVGNLAAVDADKPDQHTFTVVTGDDSFEVNASDELVTKEVFDYESQSSYTISVKVTDNAGGSFTREFIISVEDQLENTLTGTWRYEDAGYWYELSFNEDLTGTRVDADGESDTFTYTFSATQVTFTGFPNGTYDYTVNGNSLSIFGDTLTKQ